MAEEVELTNSKAATIGEEKLATRLCRACLEPIHPSAIVCKSCQTHQKYPVWISSLAPGLALVLALLSITSLLLTDILSFFFPERGAVTSFIGDHEDGRRLVVEFTNVGALPVTVNSTIYCPVFHPINFDSSPFLSGNRLRQLTLVRSEGQYSAPTALPVGSSRTVIYELIGFSHEGNAFDDDLALSSVKMNWLSRMRYGDSSPRIPEIVGSLETPEDLLSLVQAGVPIEVGEYPFYGLVRDPETGVNAVWRCQIGLQDKYGEIENSFFTNSYVGAVIEPNSSSLDWRLIFQDHAPPEVNPDVNPWQSSCGACPLARFP